MTDDEIRIAIAEVCGWKACPTAGSECWIAPNGSHTANEIIQLPDYPRDLNAMHEAEETLTDAQRCNYAARLHPQHVHHFAQADFLVCHSTAKQRAEAFLRVKGLWKEGIKDL